MNAALAATTDGDRIELPVCTRLPGNFWVVEVRLPGPVASLPHHRARGNDRIRTMDDDDLRPITARAGTTLDLEGGGRVTRLAPYPLAGALDARSRL